MPTMGDTDSGTTMNCNGTAKTPANVIPNPGFECGTDKWGAIFGTFEVVPGGRTGNAGKLTVTAAGGRMALTPDVVKMGGTQTFCATAWISGTVPFMKLRLLRDDGNGAAMAFEFSEQGPNPAGGMGFHRAPPSIVVKVPNQEAQRIQLVLEAQTNRSDGMNAQPGQYLLVDDVDVWASPSGKCDEIR
jgi:hypothetical protein